MIQSIRSSLWFKLSALSAFLLLGVLSATFALILSGVVSAKIAFMLCLPTCVVVVSALLYVLLEPLTRLADSAEVIGEGKPVTVKSNASDEIGRITRSLRSLQVSTQVALARSTRPGTSSDLTGLQDYRVVPIATFASRWTRLASVAGLVVLVVAGVTSGYFVSSGSAASLPAKPIVVERGITKDLIRMGMSAPFSGSAKALSEGMKLGLDLSFAEVNASGGVAGRRLELTALDNGYDEKRALDTTVDLVQNRHVFGMIGSVGTPTVKAALPFILQNKVLLFGPLTGSPILRKDPPDRYVFNVRASYAEETAKMVGFLTKVRRVPPTGIIVFAQADSFGDAGYEGAARTLRKLGYEGELARFGYERNSADVAAAVDKTLAYAKSHDVRAVIIVATATASAAYTAKIAQIGATVMNVSFVDGAALAQEFKDHWPGMGTGVIVTQVVPHYEAGATGVIRYRDALAKFFPDKSPGWSSLEGYVVGRLFIEGLKKAGDNPTTESVVDALEKTQDVDLGMGGTFGFGAHQASQRVWGTELTEQGTWKAMDAEWTE